MRFKNVRFNSLLRPLAATGLMILALPVGCGDGLTGEGNGVLPPLNAFLIPTPGEQRSGSAGQAACASGTSAYDLTVALIEEENAALAGDQELLAAVLAAAPDGSGPIVTYSAEVDGRTLTIEAVITDGESVLTGTLTDDGGEHAYLTGVTADDQATGTLTITPPDGADLNVVWSEAGEGRQFVRTSGASNTTFDDSDEAVRIVSGATVIEWKKSDYTGIVVDGADIGCFEGGEASDDFCDISCADTDFDAAAGDVGDLDDFDF